MRRAPLILVLLAAVLGGVFVWIAAGPAPSGGGAWDGLVSDPATRGMPPLGSREAERVELARAEEAGAVPGGRRVLEAGAPGAAPGRRGFWSDQDSDAMLASLPMREVVGVVRDASTGEALGDAIVRFSILGMSGRDNVALTDEDGRFRLQWLAAGPGSELEEADLWLEQTEMAVVHAEYVDVLKVGSSVDFAEELDAFYSEEAPLEVALVRSGAIEGRVRMTAGARTGSPTVQAWLKVGGSPGVWQSFLVRCEVDGSFLLGDIAPGEYALLARDGMPNLLALKSASMGQPGLTKGEGSAELGTYLSVMDLSVRPEEEQWSTPELMGVYLASVHVGSGELVAVDLELRTGARLDGRVITTRADGLEVPLTDSPGSARLTPLQIGLPAELALRERRPVEIDDDGRFVVSGLGPGTYRLDVLPSWGGVHSQLVTVAASGETLRADVRVPLPAVLAGVVQDESGAPVGRARIELESPGPATIPEAGELPGRVETDSDGRFELTGVPAGVPLALVVEPREKGLGATAVPLAAMSSGEVEEGLVVVLRPPLALRGVVEETQTVALNGARIPGAQVEVVQRRGKLLLGRTRAVTNAQGEFTVEGLQGAPSEVRVRAWGFVEAGYQVDLSDPAAMLNEQPVGNAVTLTLESGLVVEGIVLDESGAALGGVHVVAEAERDVHGEPLAPKRLSRTDAKGAFRFAGLADVDWTLAPQDPAYLVVERTPERVGRGFVSEGGSVELVLRHRMEAPRAEVRFDVVCSFDGAVPGDLRVVGARGASVHIDQGAVSITGLDAEVESLLVLGAGCAARAIPLQLVPGADLDLGLVELDRGVHATVRVTGAAPGAALKVELVPTTGPDGPPVGTPRVGMIDEGDAFRVAGLPQGTWRLRVVDANGQVAAELVELVDETFEHTVVLAE